MSEAVSGVGKRRPGITSGANVPLSKVIGVGVDRRQYCNDVVKINNESVPLEFGIGITFRRRSGIGIVKDMERVVVVVSVFSSSEDVMGVDHISKPSLLTRHSCKYMESLAFSLL